MPRTLRNGPVFREPIETVQPLQFKLPNSDVIATAFPVYAEEDVPSSLLDFLHEEFNKEIELGQTYPAADVMTRDEFVGYWLHSFCAIVLKTDKTEIDFNWTQWQDLLLGTFYIKPNYPGRCSHICNAGFLVNSEQRGLKVGYRLGQLYLSWAPLLGYTYSVFNLVFVTNPASWKLWDKFGFDRIGLVPKAARLKGHEELVDAIIFGRDLQNVESSILADFHI